MFEAANLLVVATAKFPAFQKLLDSTAAAAVLLTGTLAAGAGGGDTLSSSSSLGISTRFTGFSVVGGIIRS